MLESESPIKSVARVREGKGFKPLFGSPTVDRVGNVLNVPPAPPSVDRPSPDTDADADTFMHDNAATSPAGGLFAAQLEQRRLVRRSRDASPDESVAKKHKHRPSLALPGDESDDDLATSSSSPAFHRGGAASSSPHTDLTVPSSVPRPSGAVQKASSAVRPVQRTIQHLQLSDGEDEGTTITIAPYQRYGRSLLRSAAAVEDEDLSYAIPSSSSSTRYTTPSDSSDSETEPSLAGLKLSPVRHARSDRLRRDRLLSSIFEPNSRKTTVFNPEARCGPLQPSKECDELNLEGAPKEGSDDDDDWQQEVDEDFTFLDSEIELKDVA